jgi:hypothetical protein
VVRNGDGLTPGIDAAVKRVGNIGGGDDDDDDVSGAGRRGGGGGGMSTGETPRRPTVMSSEGSLSSP